MLNLLEALKESMKGYKKSHGLEHARVVHFAFPHDGSGSAFLSEIFIEELVPLLEEWCAEQRLKIGSIH